MGLGAIGLVGSLASTGLSMYGQSQAAKAQGMAADYNARMANDAAAYNAKLAEGEARNREVETTVGIQRQRASNREALAALRTRMAASGVQTTTGTPLILAGESAGRLEIGIQDAARTAAMQAASLRAQGRMGIWEADARGRLGLWEAAQASSASRTGMLATGIQGAASAYGQYRQGKYTGIY